MEHLFGAITMVVGSLEVQEEITEAVVFAAWSQCAGELIRDRTVATNFSKKRLTVAVTDRTWQSHLEELSPQMLTTINRSIGQGTVRFIEFQIDEKTVEKAHENAGLEEKRELKTVSPSLAKASTAIADESLRKRFLDAAGDYLAKQIIRDENLKHDKQ